MCNRGEIQFIQENIELAVARRRGFVQAWSSNLSGCLSGNASLYLFDRRLKIVGALSQGAYGLIQFVGKGSLGSRTEAFGQ